jgi:hypothetical protein
LEQLQIIGLGCQRLGIRGVAATQKPAEPLKTAVQSRKDAQFSRDPRNNFMNGCQRLKTETLVGTYLIVGRSNICLHTRRTTASFEKAAL